MHGAPLGLELVADLHRRVVDILGDVEGRSAVLGQSPLEVVLQQVVVVVVGQVPMSVTVCIEIEVDESAELILGQAGASGLLPPYLEPVEAYGGWVP